MSDRMLPSPWAVTFRATGEVVQDVESLARGVMGVEGWPAYLEPADNDELLTHLLGEVIVAETKYTRRDGIEARPWLFQRLRFRARDWRDRFYGHNGQHRTLAEIPNWTDDDGEHGHTHVDGQSGVGVGSFGSPGEAPGDRGDVGTDALRGLLEGGYRPLLREIETLGLGPPPGARGSTPGARAELERLERKRLERVERVAA